MHSPFSPALFLDLELLQPSTVASLQPDHVPEDEGVLGEGGKHLTDAAADPKLESSLLAGNGDAFAEITKRHQWRRKKKLIQKV
jgi:hypothetical protein